MKIPEVVDNALDAQGAFVLAEFAIEAPRDPREGFPLGPDLAYFAVTKDPVALWRRVKSRPEDPLGEWLSRGLPCEIRILYRAETREEAEFAREEIMQDVEPDRRLINRRGRLESSARRRRQPSAPR